MIRRAAQVTSDFYIANTAADGIPYWDTGAPGCAAWRVAASVPLIRSTTFEPVDSSAAAIACQGPPALWKLAACGAKSVANPRGTAAQYDGALRRSATERGLGVLSRLLEEPYLSVGTSTRDCSCIRCITGPTAGITSRRAAVPCGESSMWGDYHLREAALHAQRLISGGTPLVFWTEEEIEDDDGRSLEDRGAQLSCRATDAEPRRRRVPDPGEATSAWAT